MYSVRYGLYDNHIPTSADLRGVSNPLMLPKQEELSAEIQFRPQKLLLVLHTSSTQSPSPSSSSQPRLLYFQKQLVWWLVSSFTFKQENDSPPTNYCFSGLNLKHSHLPLFDRHCPIQKVLFAIMPYQCNSRNLRNFFTVKSSSSWLCFTRVASISIKPRVMDAKTFKNKIITQQMAKTFLYKIWNGQNKTPESYTFHVLFRLFVIFHFHNTLLYIFSKK